MEDHVTPLKTGIKYGVYLAVISIILSLAIHYGDIQDTSNPMALVNWIPMVAINLVVFILIFLGIKYYKSNNEGLLTIGEGVSVALFIALFSGIIGAVFSYIFAAYIDPTGVAEAMNSGVDMDEMTAEQAESVENMMGVMTSPTIVAFMGFLMRIVGGLIWGLIASLIQKSE